MIITVVGTICALLALYLSIRNRNNWMVAISGFLFGFELVRMLGRIG